MTENNKSALTQELLNNQRKISEDIDKLYKDVTQLIVEKEASLKTDLYLQKLSNQKLKELTKNLDESKFSLNKNEDQSLIFDEIVKHDTKKSDEIYIEHVRMLKETKLLEKLLGIHCTVSKIDENPYVVKTCVTFNEEQSVNFLFDIENGAFACKNFVYYNFFFEIF